MARTIFLAKVRVLWRTIAQNPGTVRLCFCVLYKVDDRTCYCPPCLLLLLATVSYLKTYHTEISKDVFGWVPTPPAVYLSEFCVFPKAIAKNPTLQKCRTVGQIKAILYKPRSVFTGM
jgi:hypothetical protein